MYDSGFIARLQDGLSRALPRWGLSPGCAPELLAISENATFKVEVPGANAMVFRVHRPGYHTRAEITSELAWLDALRAEGLVATPHPIRQLDGSLIADIDDRGVPRHVVAFDFIPGQEPVADAALAPWFRELGRIHAVLHDQARRWRRPTDFARKRWNFAATLGEAPLWGDWRTALGLEAPGRALLQRTVDVVGRACADLGEGPEAFGLIHADLRLANLLVDGDRLTLIDFDDCGFSWFLYDFAAAVSFIEHEPFIPELKAAWIEGYGQRARLSAEQVRQLDLFVMLRRILLTAWIASHSETPTAQSLGAAYTDGTLALAERFLSSFA